MVTPAVHPDLQPALQQLKNRAITIDKSGVFLNQ
jgi:hypothetical protein